MVSKTFMLIVWLSQVHNLHSKQSEDDDFTTINYSDTVHMSTCYGHNSLWKKYSAGLQHQWYCPEYPKFNWAKEYIPCFQCRKLYIGDCPIHGPLKVLENTPVVEEDLYRAIHTLPRGLAIRKSSIEGAGLGVFTHIDLPPRVRMGPYEGYVEYGNDNQYTWIFRVGEKDITVNGRNVSHSNWMRYINMPSCRKNENLKWFVHKGTMNYITFKPIQAGSELLIWYGDGYAQYLGKDPNSCTDDSSEETAQVST